MKPRLHIHTELESELVLLGGADRVGLLAEIERLLSYLRRAPFPLLRDIALTTGLAAHEALSRAAIVATSTADLLDKLLLLQRRLQESSAPIRIEKTGRGRFRLCVACPVLLEEQPG